LGIVVGIFTVGIVMGILILSFWLTLTKRNVQSVAHLERHGIHDYLEQSMCTTYTPSQSLGIVVGIFTMWYRDGYPQLGIVVGILVEAYTRWRGVLMDGVTTCLSGCAMPLEVCAHTRLLGIVMGIFMWGIVKGILIMGIVMGILSWALW
jgi:hypothetical protein